MNHLKDQRGVALALELVLVAMVLAVAGLGVYTAMHRRPAPVAAATPSPTPSKTPFPTPPTHFFSIAQWGVRAPYDGLDTFTVSIKSDTWGSLATVISANLAAKYPGCSTYGAGQIKRLAPTTVASQALSTDSNLTVAQYAQQNPNLGIKHVGNYYYLFTHDDAACQDNGASDGQDQANSTVKAAVANLETVN